MANDQNDLLGGFRRGEAAATRQVIAWAREAVRAGAFRLTTEDQEDVAQAVLIDLLRAVRSPGFVLRKPLRAFVRHVAAARAIDALRRRRPTLELDPDLAAATPSPYEELLSRDREALLRWALQQLGSTCRDLIRLHYDERLSYSEIAVRLRVNESTLRGRMFQCLRRAREIVQSWPGRWLRKPTTT